MSVDLEDKMLFKNVNLSSFWTNINVAQKYRTLSEILLLFLLAFPSSCLEEAGFSHVNSILTKQINKLNM